MIRITSLLYVLLALLLNQQLYSSSHTLDKEESCSEEELTVHSSDYLHFGELWTSIQTLVQKDELPNLIYKRRGEIAAIKESWRPFIAEMAAPNGSWHLQTEEFMRVFKEGRLIPSKEGSGCAYFLFDSTGKPRYIVKPFDENMNCLNNRKGRASPFNDVHHRVRDAIDIYQTAQREAAAVTLATRLSLSEVTPWTILAILRAETFYDISETLEDVEKIRFIESAGSPDKEKLCSIQPFLPESIDLGEAIHEWFEAGLEQGKEPLLLDTESFENANLLVWITYDCDGHGSNFLLYFHSLDKEGRAIYGLKKIDNGLCLPSSNRHLLNYLAYLPNAKLPLSDSLRTKIATIDSHAIAQDLTVYGLQDTIPPILMRIAILKILAQRPEMTVEEMNMRMEFLNLPNGDDLALLEGSCEELQNHALN